VSHWQHDGGETTWPLSPLTPPTLDRTRVRPFLSAAALLSRCDTVAAVFRSGTGGKGELAYAGKLP
jgi:hypothetical protein